MVRSLTAAFLEDSHLRSLSVLVKSSRVGIKDFLGKRFFKLFFLNFLFLVLFLYSAFKIIYMK